MEKLLILRVTTLPDFGSLQKTNQKIVYSTSIITYILHNSDVLSEQAKYRVLAKVNSIKNLGENIKNHPHFLASA